MLRSNSDKVAEYIRRAIESCAVEWDVSLEDWESGLRNFALFLADIAHDQTLENAMVTLIESGLVDPDEDEDDDDMEELELGTDRYDTEYDPDEEDEDE